MTQSVRILIADDAAFFRKTLEQVLSHQGWTVTAVADGQQAVEQWLANSYDLVLLDIEMPVMTGIEAVEKIRDDHDESASTIVALTSHNDESRTQQFLDAGFTKCLSKQLSPNELIAELKACLTEPAIESDSSQSSESEDRLFDPQQLLRLADGDEELASEMIEMFFFESKRQFDQIQSAINDSDFADLQRHTHRFKGTVSVFRATTCDESARLLESAAQRKDAGDVEKHWTNLQKHVADLCDALHTSQ